MSFYARYMYLICVLIVLDYWLRDICLYDQYTFHTLLPLSYHNPSFSDHCRWLDLSSQRPWHNHCDLYLTINKSSLRSQFFCKPSIYQHHHSCLTLYHYIFSLSLLLLISTYWIEDWFKVWEWWGCLWTPLG